MLKCHIIQNPDQKKALFDQFDGVHSLWVVKDLESKFWMQAYLQEVAGPIINTDGVIRASELWQKLLLRNDPSWQPLSGLVAEFLIEKWMDEIIKEKNLRISSKDRGRAYQTIGQILPLISHFQGQDIMEQWFSEKEEAKERWQDWYEMGQSLWQRFVSRKIIPQEWMKGVLINEELPPLGEVSLVVDLGIQIDDVESELFLNLSRHQDVHILVPDTEKDKEAYENFISRGQIEVHETSDSVTERQFKKLPSMLAEVKEAVAHVRRWLDQGLPPEKIAIVSPQIENYWPTIFEHGLVEGIPINKDKFTPLTQFPVYQNWLSQLRLASRRLLKGDPEQVIFGGEAEPEILYRDFQTLFSNVYDVEDLNRSDEVEKRMPVNLETGQEYSLSRFFEIAMHWVPASSLSAFNILLEDLDPVFSVNETLSFEKWVEFFEKYFARNEKRLLEGNSAGIQVLPLMAAQNPSLDKVVIIGLSEGNLLESHDTALHWADIESIKMNFGFNLPHTDRHRLLDELKWFERKFIQECILTHGETDFSGQFQAPSLFWLKGALEKKQIDLGSPGMTRWDFLCQQNPRLDLNWSTEEMDQCENGIRRDRGEVATEPVPYVNLRLSPSSLDSYFKCPFKFFASRALKLDDDPLLDLDIDPRSKGNLLHKICEVIVKNKRWSLSEKQIMELIEDCRKKKNVPIYTEDVWQFLKPFYLKATQAFLKFEIAWRQQHPNTETFAVEEFLKTHLRLTEDSFEFDAEQGIPFRGVIDRLDRNEQGQVVVIDYKSSTASLNQFTSWVQKGQIQLVLYSLAIMEGVLGGEKRDVVGAFYFALNKPERNLGFALAEAPEDFLNVKKPTSPEQFENLVKGTKQLVFNIVTDLLAGRIEPAPNKDLDEKLCEKCDWNQLCRYPALNL